MALEAFGGCTGGLAICARDGTVVEASRVFAAGRTLRDHLDPADTAGLAQLAAALDAGRGRFDACIAATWYQVELAATAAGDRVAVIAAEISERKGAEGMMIDAQGVAHLGTWEWDITQTHATWSPELFRIYDLSPAEYTPSYEAYLTKVHPDDRAHVMAATEQVFTKFEPYSHDERILRPDGSIRYLHTWARAILDEHGALKRLIGVCQDITDRKLSEIDRERVEQQLSRSQKLEALGRVTGGIAHDFNNVLNVITGYASMLDRQLSSATPSLEQQRMYVKEITSAADRAARMTQELLAFSRDHALARRGAIDLDQTIEDLAPFVGTLCGSGIRVEHALAGGTTVQANPSQLEQVIMNLAANARDAMPDGGTLRIATRTGDDGAHLVISDTGVGMSAEVQARIFDPFFTTKDVGRGTGLGLSTVYGIVTQSGGSIAVTSSPGEGTQFDIVLPAIARTIRS